MATQKVFKFDKQKFCLCFYEIDKAEIWFTGKHLKEMNTGAD